MRKMVLVLLLLAMPAVGWADEINYNGQWSALSKNHYSISGDMEVFDNEIVWKKHGAVKFKIIEKKSDALIVELDREIDCGRYLRLGPLEGSKLEVAFYKTAAEALSPKRRRLSWSPDKDTYSPGCSWGIYLGPQSK